MAEATTNTAQTPDAAKKTTYHVLRQDVDGGRYDLVTANLPASNAEAAVRGYIANTGAVEGVYVAVPSRSWRPTKVTVATTTVLKLADA
jgi:hypothetical protein